MSYLRADALRSSMAPCCVVGDLNPNYSDALWLAVGPALLIQVMSTGLWLTTTDPGFASIAALNFTLPAARVRPHIPGWAEIPFGEVGLQGATAGPSA